MKELIEILKYKLIWLNILLLMVFLILSFYYSKAAVLLFLLISNLFDILGYHFSLIRRENKAPEKIIVRSYKINQFMFDLLLLLLIGILFNWLISLTAWILKLFGLQDIFYYMFLNEKLPEKWNWMKWISLGFIKGMLSKHEIIIQALVGIIISILLLFLI